MYMDMARSEISAQELLKPNARVGGFRSSDESGNDRRSPLRRRRFAKGNRYNNLRKQRKEKPSYDERGFTWKA